MTLLLLEELDGALVPLRGRRQQLGVLQAFSTAADGVDDVTFNCGIECRSLLRDARLDLLKLRLN